MMVRVGSTSKGAYQSGVNTWLTLEGEQTFSTTTMKRGVSRLLSAHLPKVEQISGFMKNPKQHATK